MGKLSTSPKHVNPNHKNRGVEESKERFKSPGQKANEARKNPNHTNPGMRK